MTRTATRTGSVRTLVRWRVHPGWYAVVFLALPAAVLVAAGRLRPA